MPYLHMHLWFHHPMETEKWDIHGYLLITKNIGFYIYFKFHEHTFDSIIGKTHVWKSVLKTLLINSPIDLLVPIYITSDHSASRCLGLGAISSLY